MTTDTNQQLESHAEINAALAATTAVTMRVDRLCRVIERFAASNPIIARVAYTIATQTMHSIEANINNPAAPNHDDTGKFLHDITLQNLKTAMVRLENTKVPAQEILDPTRHISLFLGVEHAAIAAQMAYHGDQVTLSPNPQARLAHIQAANHLNQAFEDNLYKLGQVQPTQPDANNQVAIDMVKENAQSTIDAYRRIMSAKRTLLPVVISSAISLQAQEQIQAQVEEFRKRDEPVTCHLASARSPLGTATAHTVVVIYEQPDAIHVAIAGEEYPPGTSTAEAMSHADYIGRWGTVIQEQASNQEQADMANAVINAAISLANRAAAGLHTTNLEEIAALIARTKELGIDPATIRNMITAVANLHSPVADTILVATDSATIATNEQANAIIAAAEHTGVPQGTINALVTFLGIDPITTGKPAPVYPYEHLTELAELALNANIPADNALAMLAATGITLQRAAKIVDDVGYQRPDPDDEYLTLPGQ